jgi:sugar phosphate isomerase/epimerase
MSPSSGGSGGQYEIGVQSFTYREFDIPAICSELSDTGVSAIELCDVHVGPDAGADEVESVRDRLADSGIEVCGYGVVSFEDADEERVRATFELVDRLGGDYCSLEFPPADEAIRDRLLPVAAEFDLDLAIHNHGPGETYSRVEEVASVLDAADDPRLGACVDTGHFLRSGEEPAEVIPRLGDRVLALHLKDFDDEENETVPGTGRIDLSELLELLETETSFDQPLVIEYEANAEDPTPAVEQTVTAVRDVME